MQIALIARQIKMAVLALSKFPIFNRIERNRTVLLLKIEISSLIPINENQSRKKSLGVQRPGESSFELVYLKSRDELLHRRRLTFSLSLSQETRDRQVNFQSSFVSQ